MVVVRVKYGSLRKIVFAWVFLFHVFIRLSFTASDYTLAEIIKFTKCFLYTEIQLSSKITTANFFEVYKIERFSIFVKTWNSGFLCSLMFKRRKNLGCVKVISQNFYKLGHIFVQIYPEIKVSYMFFFF